MILCKCCSKMVMVLDIHNYDTSIAVIYCSQHLQSFSFQQIFMSFSNYLVLYFTNSLVFIRVRVLLSTGARNFLKVALS